MHTHIEMAENAIEKKCAKICESDLWSIVDLNVCQNRFLNNALVHLKFIINWEEKCLKYTWLKMDLNPKISTVICFFKCIKKLCRVQFKQQQKNLCILRKKICGCVKIYIQFNDHKLSNLQQKQAKLFCNLKKYKN